MGRMDSRVALVSGAARGMGAAVVRRFIAEGGKVVIADLLEAEGQALADELGAMATFIRLDVTSEQQWEEAVQYAEEAFGKLDTLVNNAGIIKTSSLLKTSLEEYMAVVQVNQVGCFLGMKIAGRAIIAAGGGAIVNISSTAGLWGVPFSSAYCASKFAVTGMTKVAAMELGKKGIRVNSVHPGTIDTAMIQTGDFEGVDPNIYTTHLPLARLGQPDEVAQTVLYLASDEASFCTGGSYTVDGGAMAGDRL